MTPSQALSPTSISSTPRPAAVASPRPSLQHRQSNSDPTRLAPEDAYANSPPRQRDDDAPNGIPDSNGAGLGRALTGSTIRGPPSSRRRREKERGRSASRRRKGVWKKLLWVKHIGYPDNYTDEDTFLDHLQRNPRLQPYDFWPLVADSTVIVQHVCSVIVFVCCFAGIIQERVSPVVVVSWGSFGTVLGWVAWDWWIGQEEAAAGLTESTAEGGEDGSSASSTASSINGPQIREAQGLGLALSTPPPAPRQGHSHSASATSIQSSTSASPVATGHPTGAANFANYSYYPPYGAPASSFSPRNQQRLATAKSAVLIYCALLGMSPILKSLTESTTSDSIWAMSCWLMCINVFFFDYGGGVGVKFPASLSTNAALMASTVLASRLNSTTHVFSLTLFSIEVFGLFPVFRRHLRHISWRGHLLLTIFLVMGAGGGVAVTISGGGWKAATAGVVLGCLLTGLAMGGCSWWLIGLQKYKNEIHGPWDPARPVIRRQWD
ncbi:MAG: hypothetical protein M1827_007402 [Pycnora praestabilis]|nr:MAG: hypothetical protein M1827_007402 [Pycnora praestabilis]